MKCSFQFIFIFRILKKTVKRILTQNGVNLRSQLFYGKVLTAEITDQAVQVLAKPLQIVSKLYVHSQ